MIQQVTAHALEEVLKKSHPHWIPEAVTQEANDILIRLDPRLEPALIEVASGRPSPQYSYGEFSIWMLRAFKKCSDLDAILLLDAYMKDPVGGRALIMRR